jgi:hypothetical protein
MAFSAARRLASDIFGLLEGKEVSVLCGGHRKYRQSVPSSYQGELFTQLIGVPLDLVQRNGARELAFEGDINQLPARFFAGGLGVVIRRLSIELGVIRVCRAGHGGGADDARDPGV